MAKNKKTIEHPLEDFFNIEKKSTEVVVHERNTELTKVDSYDDKDRELEEDFQEIYDKALDGYDDLSESVHTIEGKYKARLSEVAIQHLNTALNAAAQKAKLKELKDKLEHSNKKPPSQVTNNTLVVEDRNAFLRQMRQMAQQDQQQSAIDAEVEEINNDEKDE